MLLIQSMNCHHLDWRDEYRSGVTLYLATTGFPGVINPFESICNLAKNYSAQKDFTKHSLNLGTYLTDPV